MCVGCIEQCNCGALCNIVVIPMRAWDREKSEGSGTRCNERVSRESRFVVHVRGHALTRSERIRLQHSISTKAIALLVGARPTAPCASGSLLSPMLSICELQAPSPVM